MRGLLLAALACLVSLVAGRRLELVLPEGSDACGAACCCVRGASPACCAEERHDALPRLAATCGCAGPGELLHLVLEAGDWILPPPPAELAAPERAWSPACGERDWTSRNAEPETPPPRGGLDRSP